MTAFLPIIQIAKNYEILRTICVRLEMRFSHSSPLGWNTFPVPMFNEQTKTDRHHSHATEALKANVAASALTYLLQ